MHSLILGRRFPASYSSRMYASSFAAPAVGPSMRGHAPVCCARPQLRPLGVVPYRDAWRRMREFTDRRDAAVRDCIWWLEHPPVYTLGLSGRSEQLPECAGIESVHSDRGGQLSYHGPGQLVVYPLIDLRRSGLRIRAYVHLLEQSIIDTLEDFGVPAQRRPNAPGVYTQGGKIASLGIRVRHGCTYHGVALNVDLDLAPFRRICPCGEPGLLMTSLAAQGVRSSVAHSAARLLPRLCALLSEGDAA